MVPGGWEEREGAASLAVGPVRVGSLCDYSPTGVGRPLARTPQRGTRGNQLKR